MAIITVRVSDQEKVEIDKAAKADDRSTNSYVVKAVKEKMARDAKK